MIHQGRLAPSQDPRNLAGMLQQAWNGSAVRVGGARGVAYIYTGTLGVIGLRASGNLVMSIHYISLFIKVFFNGYCVAGWICTGAHRLLLFLMVTAMAGRGDRNLIPADELQRLGFAACSGPPLSPRKRSCVVVLLRPMDLCIGDCIGVVGVHWFATVPGAGLFKILSTTSVRIYQSPLYFMLNFYLRFG